MRGAGAIGVATLIRHLFPIGFRPIGDAAMYTRRTLVGLSLLPLALIACSSGNKDTSTESPKPAPAHTAPPEPAKPTPAAKPTTPSDEEEVPSRAAAKVRFGAQPAYDYDGEGVKIDQVMPDTSAEEGGVKSGDILKTWNGKKIDDIYKWMAYLGEANPGDVVDVGVLRDKKTVSLKVKLKPAE
jgi:hypothetical protein